LTIATLEKVIIEELICDEVEEDWSRDSLAPKYLSLEMKEGMKALTIISLPNS